MRNFLSDLFRIPPLDIPLNAPPGEPPILKEKLGYIGLSHCKDSILLGWSKEKIGIDIERIDRKFPAKIIYQKYYTENEQKELVSLSRENLRLMTLKLWVLKESSTKWEYGSIVNGLTDWEISHNLKKAFNKVRNINLNTNCFSYQSWFLGLASKSSNIKFEIVKVIP